MAHYIALMAQAQQLKNVSAAHRVAAGEQLLKSIIDAEDGISISLGIKEMREHERELAGIRDIVVSWTYYGRDPLPPPTEAELKAQAEIDAAENRRREADAQKYQEFLASQPPAKKKDDEGYW